MCLLRINQLHEICKSMISIFIYILHNVLFFGGNWDSAILLLVYYFSLSLPNISFSKRYSSSQEPQLLEVASST